MNDVDSDSEQADHRGACSDDHSLAISMQEAESAGVGCFRHEPPPGDAELAQYLAHKEVGPRLRPHPRPRMPRVDPPCTPRQFRTHAAGLPLGLSTRRTATRRWRRRARRSSARSNGEKPLLRPCNLPGIVVDQLR